MRNESVCTGYWGTRDSTDYRVFDGAPTREGESDRRLGEVGGVRNAMNPQHVGV